ncbi:MAG: T9SS type A sorting domain-containing protein [bacterium]
MKKQQTIAFFLILFLFLPAAAFSQSELSVPPWNGSNYLNDVIAGDTTATGARNDMNRVYVLQRNGVYFVNTQMRNSGWPLNIKASDGTGRRPVIYLVKNTTTSNNPAAFVRVAEDLNLKSVVITGILEPDTSSYALMQGQLIGTNQPGFDIIIDDCILSNSNGNHMRTDQAQRYIKVTNTIFANMGYLGTSNLGAGKAIDLRAGSIDTLIFLNNTFVNAQDRIIRHFNSTASINYLNFDHNTIVNSMSYHGTLVLGKVGNNINITNNLFIDPFSLGNDTDYVRQAEFNESGETDFLGKRRMSWIFSVNNDTTEFDISKNYYSISDSGAAFYARNLAAGVTGEGSPLSWHLNSRLGPDSVSAFTKQAILLNNIPKLMTKMMDWYRRPVAQGGAGKSKATTNFNRKLHDYDRRDWIYFSDTLNCAYPTTVGAYTGSAGGFPVGDLNWFPSKKAEWEIWLTDVKELVGGEIPTSFSLQQNYPNPFNPSTKITFDLKEAGLTTLEVYNVIGQKVATLVNKDLKSGKYEFSFDASKLSSGVYFYKLESGNNVSTKKMMLLK